MRDRWKDCSDEELIIRLREGEQEVMDYLIDILQKASAEYDPIVTEAEQLHYN